MRRISIELKIFETIFSLLFLTYIKSYQCHIVASTKPNYIRHRAQACLRSQKANTFEKSHMSGLPNSKIYNMQLRFTYNSRVPYSYRIKYQTLSKDTNPLKPRRSLHLTNRTHTCCQILNTCCFLKFCDQE